MSDAERIRQLENTIRLLLVPIDVLHEIMQAKHIFSQPFQAMIRVAWEEGRKCLGIKTS